MSQNPIEYRNNPSLNYFKQSTNGFGFANMRIDDQTPQSINRVTTDLQVEQTHQYTNPITDYDQRRHSNFLFSEHYKDYKLLDQQDVPDNYNYWDILKTFQERNPMMDFFFSKKNIDHLQNLIIQMVEFQSSSLYKITRQSDNELLVVMRSIYITTPTNPYSTGEQFKRDICTLNKNVLDWVVPRILVNVQQYLGYVKDKGNNTRPLPHPEYMSGAGNRVNRGFDITFV